MRNAATGTTTSGTTTNANAPRIIVRAPSPYKTGRNSSMDEDNTIRNKLDMSQNFPRSTMYSPNNFSDAMKTNYVDKSVISHEFSPESNAGDNTHFQPIYPSPAQ